MNELTSRPIAVLAVYNLTAIQAFTKEAGSLALALLENSQRLDVQGILTTLVNRLVSLPDQSFLILKDYHAITNTQIHEGVAFLLEHLPPTLHLVILPRSDPPLARMRARNEILEIRAPSLRFSAGEIREFFQQALPYALSADMMNHRAERTEGRPGCAWLP